MARYGAKYVKWAPYKTADSSSAAPVYDNTKAVELSELTTANWTPTIASGSSTATTSRLRTSRRSRAARWRLK